MVLDLMSQINVFEDVIGNVHFFILDFLTLLHRAIAIILSPSVIVGISFKKEEPMTKKSKETREVEHGSVPPLAFSAAGGMGPTLYVVYKGISSLKHGQPYSKTIIWLRCRLSYSLLRSSMCSRGARSALRCPIRFFEGEILF